MVVFVVHCVHVLFLTIGHQFSKPALITEMEQEDEMETKERIHYDTCTGECQAYMGVSPPRSDGDEEEVHYEMSIREL